MNIHQLIAGFSLLSVTANAFGAGELQASPPDVGLVAWLDASANETIELNEDSRIIAWKSREPAWLDAILGEQATPASLVADAFGRDKPGVRFDGRSWFELPKIGDSDGDVTVFVVFQRSDEQASGTRWQRLISRYDGVSSNDTKGGGMFLDTRGTADAIRARTFTASFQNVDRGPITIGRNQKSGTERLQGDIAEILIYDRSFLVDEQFVEVQDYLAAKWRLVEDLREDWTRARPLGKTPVRISEVLPLSDQSNEGNWKLWEPMTDGFESPELDPSKWYDHNPWWYGRAPALFLPSNVNVSDGELQLTMRHDPDLPTVRKYSSAVYRDYSSASVVSRSRVLYGYFEIEAKAMNSAGSSAWWLAGTMLDDQGRESRTEIDVFELGGKARGHENRYHMNAHIFSTPEEGKNKWNRGGTWKASFNFADGYHVFGLEWTPEFIKYYVDGVLVRRMPNTHWHTPIRMIFDSETMTDWLGWPDPADLPSTFSVRYVRAWKNAETISDTESRWRPKPRPNDVTSFVRDFEQRLGRSTAKEP